MIFEFTMSSLDIVEVDVAITLEEEAFDNELENKSSARYQELEKKVEEEVRKQSYM